jgi:hypothetical protein
MAHSAMCGEFRQCVRALNLPIFLFSFNHMAAMWATPPYAKALPALQPRGAEPAQARQSAFGPRKTRSRHAGAAGSARVPVFLPHATQRAVA